MAPTVASWQRENRRLSKSNDASNESSGGCYNGILPCFHRHRLQQQQHQGGVGHRVQHQRRPAHGKGHVASRGESTGRVMRLRHRRSSRDLTCIPSVPSWLVFLLSPSGFTAICRGWRDVTPKHGDTAARGAGNGTHLPVMKHDNDSQCKVWPRLIGKFPPLPSKILESEHGNRPRVQVTKDLANKRYFGQY